MATKTKTPKRFRNKKTLYIVGGIALLAVAFFYFRRRSNVVSAGGNIAPGTAFTTGLNPAQQTTNPTTVGSSAPSSSDITPDQFAQIISGITAPPSGAITQSDLSSQLNNLQSNIAAMVAGVTLAPTGFAQQTPAATADNPSSAPSAVAQTPPTINVNIGSAQPATAPQRKAPVINKKKPPPPHKVVPKKTKPTAKVTAGKVHSHVYRGPH